MSTMRDEFDCTPQQYHASLDILWNALGVTTAQDKTVFELVAERIKTLEAACKEGADELCQASCLVERQVDIKAFGKAADKLRAALRSEK